MKTIKRAVLATLLVAGFAVAAQAQGQSPEATIRKNLGERIPQLSKIDEVSKTPMPGLWEVRIGTDIFYTDPQANYLIQGAMLDTRNKRNLTQDRMDKLLAVDFASLPMKDAFTIVRGNGKRKLAVFEDPNCPYCKRFEHDLQKVDNVTIHMFLFPILGADSAEKSRNIWCAKDSAKAWTDWMLRGQTPSDTGKCDTGALARNVAFGHAHKITGTPTLIFADGSRVPGAISAAEVEKHLNAATPK